jgi:hypothetical protein
MTGMKEISKYKLYLVGVEEVRWDSGSTVHARNIPVSMKRGMRIMN